MGRSENTFRILIRITAGVLALSVLTVLFALAGSVWVPVGLSAAAFAYIGWLGHQLRNDHDSV